MKEDISSWIVGLMRTQSDALGFIPSTSVHDKYVCAENFIIQHDEHGAKVGYILHGPIRYGKNVVISQAVIDMEKRRRHYGFLAVDELVTRCKSRNASSISLRCAADLEAVQFWQAVGFQLNDIVPGGERRGRMICRFFLPLALPLFLGEAR